MHLLRSLSLSLDSRLAKHFMPHQVNWIQAEKRIHNQHKQAVALAEKSVRIGWTYADGFKNVRKRLWFKKRDYLFATKDYPSALEYVQQCYQFAEVFNLTRSIISHGEENLLVNRLDEHGRSTSFTEDVKIGVIKFDNGSRIIAFSANPQAMSVYGGDVGLDEFAKHPNAKLLWETAQGRVAWGYDIAVWSSHDGEDTLFNEFAQEARAQCTPGLPTGALPNPSIQQSITPVPSAPNRPSIQQSTNPLIHPSPVPITPPLQHSNTPVPSPITPVLHSPWNIYFRVTLPDAIRYGLVDTINRTRATKISPAQFLADCRARARHEEIFEQSYMCNPAGAATNHIVEWSAIERCRADYPIERVHLEADQVLRQFGQAQPSNHQSRQRQIHDFIRHSFPDLFSPSIENQNSKGKNRPLRLGFDVAASGQGSLAVIYIDEFKPPELWLRALFTCRTDDWHFLGSVLFCFLEELRSVQGAGDETGLGRQICWEAARQFGSRFLKVNFASKKSDLGFALMNQLSSGEKRFPRSEDDIAADFFALRKFYTGTRWTFSEGRNTLNPDSHCDIAWAAALATHAHTQRRATIGSRLG